MKVDFIILGAQKSATTTLCNVFRRHPQVSFCIKKEPNYFVGNFNWRDHLDEYHAKFPQRENCLYGEASVSYTYHPYFNRNVWEDLYEYNPDLKFIYMVRNPIDRIVSAYMHRFERGYTKKSLEEEVNIPDNELVQITRYSYQITPFIKLFGREKVLLIDFDDFNKNRPSEIRRIADFLGLDLNQFVDFENLHKNTSIAGSKVNKKLDKMMKPMKTIGRIFPKSFRQFVFKKFLLQQKFKEKPKLSVESQKKLIAQLETEINELGKLMNKDLSNWLQVRP